MVQTASYSRQTQLAQSPQSGGALVSGTCWYPGLPSMLKNKCEILAFNSSKQSTKLNVKVLKSFLIITAWQEPFYTFKTV